jgi:hypothetical protein
VAVGAVVKLKIGAVGMCAVQVHRVLTGRVIPAAPQDAPVGQHGGVAVVALVEGDLMHLGAVGVQAAGVVDLQYERRLLPILILRGELRFALIEQDPL